MAQATADCCFFQQIGLALHDEFTGSQLDAATAFLHAHPGQVSPITLSIGAGDRRLEFLGSGLGSQSGQGVIAIA
jgi:hypothetical protein